MAAGEVSLEIRFRSKESLRDKLEQLLGEMLNRVVVVNQESVVKSPEAPKTPRTPSPYEDF